MDARTRNEVRPGRGFSLADDADQIKQDIDRTRAHLDETVSALSERLTPRNLVDEFLDMFTKRRVEEPVGEPQTGEVLGAIRDNPIPAALIGAGVVYFLFNRNRGAQRTRIYDQGGTTGGTEVGRYRDQDWLSPGATYQEGGVDSGGKMHQAGGMIRDKSGQMMHKSGETVRHWAEGAKESAGHAAHSAGERISGAASGLAHKAGEQISSVAHKAGEQISSAASSAAHRAGEGLSHAAHGVGHQMSGMAHQAGQGLSHAASNVRNRVGKDGRLIRARTSEAAHTVRNTVEDYPIVFGAAALAIGLIAGLSAPSTRPERRVMGPMRDDLLEEGQRTLKEDVMPRVREAAEQVAKEIDDAATDEVSKKDRPIGERLSKAASAGIHAGGEALRKETSDKSDQKKNQGGMGQNKPISDQNKPFSDQNKPVSGQNKPFPGQVGKPNLGSNPGFGQSGGSQSPGLNPGR